jgi:hypothetical protein
MTPHQTTTIETLIRRCFDNPHNQEAFRGFRDEFYQYLSGSVVAVGRDQSLIAEACRRTFDECEKAFRGERADFHNACYFAALGWKLLIDLVRERQPSRRLRIDGLFDKIVGSHVERQEYEHGWVLLICAIMRLDAPCGLLILDYYVREQERPFVSNQWNKRAWCKTTLDKGVRALLGIERVSR